MRPATAGWPSGRPRVLVADGWLANAGDAAITLATDSLVRSVWHDAAVLHASYHVDLVANTVPELDFVPPLDALLGVDGAEAIDGWITPDGERLVREADLVVSQGGGFLLEHYAPWPRLFAHVRVVELGVPFAILGQTIGTFRAARARALLRRSLRAAAAVTLRDAPSVDHAIELGADPARVARTSDLSLLLFPDPPPKTSGATESGVAVVLTRHEQQTPGDDADRARLSARVLADVVDRTGDSERITVLSTAQGLGGHGVEDDGDVAKAAVAALEPGHRPRIAVVEGYLGPRTVIEMLARHRAVVTQRLHPALFALSQGVPAAVLVDADKVGALDGVDLGPARCASPSDDEARGAALDSALDSNARRGVDLWEALALARDRAALNRDVLAELLPTSSSVG
jgi:polysaccharide pyruvyl transferase WcaK-like protein